MTRLSRLLVVVLCSFLVACGAGAQEPAVEMDGAMAEFARLDLFSGTVLVARGGNIVYATAFGEANKDHRVANILETKFNIGSIGKTFTAVAIMQLVEQGKVELTAPVSRYLDGFPYGESITIHHLLSHTSGLFNYMAHPEFRARMSGLRKIDDWLPLIYDQELVFDPPGERFAYSNSGIVTLGAVIEQVSGMPYESYIQTNILAPTGMTDTGLNYPEEIVANRAAGYTKRASGNFTAAILQVPPASADGGIETTVLDMLKFDRALYGDSLLERGGYRIRGPFELNRVGYELLGGGEVEMAIATFKLNVNKFPADPNAYDSLAESYLTKGDREEAINMYRKALEVDPTFENSRQMLERLTAAENAQ